MNELDMNDIFWIQKQADLLVLMKIFIIEVFTYISRGNVSLGIYQKY